MVARKKRPPLVGKCSDGAWTAPASGGCAPPGPATRWSPLRGDCAALRSPRAHGRTRCASFGRSARTCGREPEGWARWRAPRPWPCAARHRVLCRPRRGAATARSHDLDRAKKHPPLLRVPRSGMGDPLLAMPRCLPRDPGVLQRFGPHQRARCAAQEAGRRACAPPFLTHGRMFERSVPIGDAARVRPCAPTSSSTTQSAHGADRDTGPEPVQGIRISCATFFARALRARTTCPNVCEAFTLQTE